MKTTGTSTRQEVMAEIARQLNITPGEAARLASNGVRLEKGLFTRSGTGLLYFRSQIMRLSHPAPATPERCITTLVSSWETSVNSKQRRVFKVYAYGVHIGNVATNNIQGWDVIPLSGGIRRAREYALGNADTKMEAVKRVLYIMARNV